MALLSAAQLREHLDADLSDVALEEIIEAADAAIVERCGPHEGAVTVIEEGGHILVRMRSLLDADQPITVTETVGQTSTELDPADYRVRFGGLALERRNVGPHPRDDWGREVEITYTPISQVPQRKAVLVHLVRLHLAQTGHTDLWIGDVRQKPLDYGAERERLLAALSPRSPLGAYA